MAPTSILTASMAGEEQLVFHDFLGLTCQKGEPVSYSEFKVLDAARKSKKDQVQEVEREEGAVKSASTSTGRFDDFSPSTIVSEQLSWPQGTGGALYKPESIIRQGKRRDSAGSGEFSPQQLQMGADASETSPHLKVSRFERVDDKRIGHVEARRDFTMQPPQMSSNLRSSQTSVVVKPGLHMAMPSMWDNSRHLVSNYTFRPAQAGLRNLQSDKLALSNIRENSAIALGPPADEGSRTGLKGSSVGILLSSPSTDLVPGAGATHTNPSSGRSKSWSRIAGSESMYVASQQTTTPTSRQLTIFYGGQAHVFDDVPSDKADAIMTLAGSSGRSWSTMYTPRSKASVPGLESKLPQSVVEGERSSVSKASAVDCARQSASGTPLTTLHSDARHNENQVLRNPGNPSVSDSRGMPELL